MNYIGSKLSLLAFIEEAIRELVGDETGRLCDPFAGTGAVGAHFKRLGWTVTASDLQRYACIRNGHLLLVDGPHAFAGLIDEVPGLAGTPLVERAAHVCAFLDALPGEDGFIFSNFCLGGTAGSEYERLYFSDDNGRRCDAVRGRIARWSDEGRLTVAEEDLLLAALLEAIDKVANTASVYISYLKQLKRTARAPMRMVPLPIIPSAGGHTVHCTDANQLIREVCGDVLYLDPPYNDRQYAAYYHLLETIARNDRFEPRGKTGQRDYAPQKSAYSSRRQVRAAFADLIAHADFRYVVMSYNNEGLLSAQDIAEVMGARGTYTVKTMRYSRFRQDAKDARNHAADEVVEYLHCLEVTTPPAGRRASTALAAA